MMKLGNHVPKLEKLMTEGKITPGQVVHVSIRHDDWCALLKKGQACNCDPFIYIGDKRLA